MTSAADVTPQSTLGAAADSPGCIIMHGCRDHGLSAHDPPRTRGRWDRRLAAIAAAEALFVIADELGTSHTIYSAV